RVCFVSSRRRHTRSTRDWSSDVCSSDLMMRDPLRSERHGRTLVVYVGAEYDSLNEDSLRDLRTHLLSFADLPDAENLVIDLSVRSEERRVGKECSSPLSTWLHN